AAPGPAAGSGGAGTSGDDGVGGPVTGLGDASGDADATLVDRDGAKTGGLTIHTGVAGVSATGNGVARCWIAVSHSKLAWASAARASAPSRRVHRLRLRGGAGPSAPSLPGAGRIPRSVEPAASPHVTHTQKWAELRRAWPQAEARFRQTGLSAAGRGVGSLKERRPAAHDRYLLLADAEREEGDHPAGGMRASLQHRALQHRPRRSVHGRVPEDQPQQPDAGYGRPRAGGR